MSRVVILAAMLVAIGGAAHAQLLPPPIIVPTSPPKSLPGLKNPFKHTHCTMSGPAWVRSSGHGSRYRVDAWGLKCRTARRYLRAFFPKIPPHPQGTLTGGPKGYRCTGVDYHGTCKRRASTKRFSWRPTGGTVG